MNGRVQSLTAVVLVVLAIAAPLVGSVSLASATSSPGGMVGVPDANIATDLPAQTGEQTIPGRLAWTGSVMASDHAETLQVEVTTARRAGIAGTGAGDALAVNLSDSQAHAGRTVALPADAVRQSIGRIPEFAYGVHESGDRWRSPVQQKGNVVVFDVPHFSTNTVTFSGEVVINATASDGSSFVYDVNDLDAVSDPDVTLTGAIATEWDNVTATSVSDGGSVDLAVAGSMDPSGPSANDEPEVTFTGVSGPYDETNPFRNRSSLSDGTAPLYGDDGGNNGVRSSTEFVPNRSGQLTNVTMFVSGADGSYSTTIDIRLDEGGADSSWGEGTLVKSDHTPAWATETIEFDTNVTVQAGKSYELEIITASSDGDGFAATTDADYNSSAGSTKYAYTYTGTYTKPYYVDMGFGIKTQTDSPSVDTDGDGTADASHSGVLGEGETATAELANLTTSTDTASVSTVSGEVDLAFKFQERAETKDPSIGVNANSGGWLNHTGTLNDGETVNLTGNSSWLQNGTNQVTVSMPAISADAPALQVGLDYNHTAEDDQSVDYTAGQWIESYNISKTYASDRANAQAMIPFVAEVVRVQSVETRVNGSTWQSVASGDYTLDNTTLTVHLGDVKTNATVDVRTTGEKVDVEGGTIQVTTPTAPGEALNSDIEVTSANSSKDLAIGVEGTHEGNLVHYTAEESWTADEYGFFTSDGSQTLVLAGASDGSAFRVSTIPIDPDPSGDVAIEVEDPRTTEPKFVVSHGNTEGETVKYTHVGAQDGETYELWSHTHERVYDTGTAQSPLTLTDDDDNETLEFRFEVADGDGSTLDGGSSSGDGSGGGAVTAGRTAFIGVIAALFAGVWVLSNTFGSGRVSTRLLLFGEGVLVATLALETLSTASLVAGVVEAMTAFAGQLGGGVAKAMPLVVLVGGGLLYYWLRNRSKPEKVVNLKVGGGEN